MYFLNEIKCRHDISSPLQKINFDVTCTTKPDHSITYRLKIQTRKGFQKYNTYKTFHLPKNTTILPVPPTKNQLMSHPIHRTTQKNGGQNKVFSQKNINIITSPETITKHISHNLYIFQYSHLTMITDNQESVTIVTGEFLDYTAAITNESSIYKINTLGILSYTLHFRKWIYFTKVTSKSRILSVYHISEYVVPIMTIQIINNSLTSLNEKIQQLNAYTHTVPLRYIRMIESPRYNIRLPRLKIVRFIPGYHS